MALESLLIGAVSALAPKLLDYFNNRQDNKQELAMLKAQLESAERTQAIKFDISAIDGAEASYRASLNHDIAAGNQKANTWLGRYFFDFMAVWRSSIRPGIVTALVAMYITVKYFTCKGLLEDGMQLTQAVPMMWTPQDWELLLLCVGYYFTNRGIEKCSGRA